MRLILVVLFLFSVPLFADREEIQEERIVILSANEVYNGDLFCVGRSVEISGTVNGDVYIVGGQVTIDGVVNGDVLAIGGSLSVSGHVTHNCRLVGAQVLLSGVVGNNISVVSANLQLLSGASLGGNLVAASAVVDTSASVGSSVTVVAANMRVSSHIHQNLNAYVGKLRLTSKAVIDGNVDYRSNTPASIDSGAVILGQVIYRPSLIHKIVNTAWVHQLFIGSKILATLMNVIYTLVIGICLVKIFPSNLEDALYTLSHKPLKSLLYGILFLILVPLLFLLLLITILGVPFALALMAFNVIGFYSAKVYSILWISNWIFKRMGVLKNNLWAFSLVTAVYFGLTAIPGIGFLLAFVAMLFGLGAGITAQKKHGVFSLKR